MSLIANIKSLTTLDKVKTNQNDKLLSFKGEIQKGAF